MDEKGDLAASALTERTNITPPPDVDVGLVAPRMIGTDVRELYTAGRGFTSFISVAQDVSGQAKDIALPWPRALVRRASAGSR